MIRLTLQEESVYEALKVDDDIKRISTVTGIKEWTVRKVLRELVKIGMASRKGSTRKYNYKSLDVKYETMGKRTRRTSIDVVTAEKDHLVENSMAVKLDKEQQFYLKHNMKTKRSVLAKRLGLTRLELNFVLEKIKRKPM